MMNLTKIIFHRFNRVDNMKVTQLQDNLVLNNVLPGKLFMNLFNIQQRNNGILTHT
jgi:hypothetical protein